MGEGVPDVAPDAEQQLVDSPRVLRPDAVPRAMEDARQVPSLALSGGPPSAVKRRSVPDHLRRFRRHGMPAASPRAYRTPPLPPRAASTSMRPFRVPMTRGSMVPGTVGDSPWDAGSHFR
ncbi:MAG: hypothetical protein ACK56I_25925, partial [bacterium]